MQNETQQNEFSGWARVEVMGHQTHIGFVTTQVFGQAVMFRIDQPPIPGEETKLAHPEWVGDTYAPVGSTVKRPDIPSVSVLVGAGSIYRIIPCDEQAAMKAARDSQRPPLMLVKLAEGSQAALPGTDDDEDNYLRDLETQAERQF